MISLKKITDIELMSPQTHKNITAIPLKTAINYTDFITLKMGIELGLVEVKECEHSQVSTLIVKNNSVTPLLLVDGEEVIGGDQNRIVNSTIIIESKNEMKIPVSCTEKGRWGYKSEFVDSDYIATYNTRRAKAHAYKNNKSVQDAIWSSIDVLEEKNSFASATSAMEESYGNLNSIHKGIVENFKIHPEQNGIMILIDGEVKGLELFSNPTIYRQFHEKILKSYLIDAKIEDNLFTIDIESAKYLIKKIDDSTFEKQKTVGLEEAYDFENGDGFGKAYLYNDTIIHLSYFKKMEDDIKEEILGKTELKMDI